MRTLLISLALVTVVAPATQATAQAGTFNVAALLGYGWETDAESYNPYGFGLGLRGGLTLSNIYFGAAGVYFVGQDTELEGLEAATNTFMFGGEVGYRIDIPAVSLIPYLGIGVSGQAIEILSGPTDRTAYMYFAPGGMVTLGLGPIYLGVDFRYHFLTGDGSVNGPALFGMVGLGL